MFAKIIKAKFKNRTHDVLVFFYGDEDGNINVRIQSMMNEFFLIEDMTFPSRDSAYDFIKLYPKEMAHAFLIREGYNSGATEK